jgi:hypothetical protein
MNNIIPLGCLLMILGLSALAPAPGLRAAEAVSYGSQEQIFSQAELEQLLAPIALYPDSLLTHILIASSYPLELVQAQRWLKKQKKSDVNKIMQKAEDKDWDPSVKALLAFPYVLQRLNDDLEWTQKLGEAFLQDEQGTLQAVQSLRRQADKANSLAAMDNVAVERVNNKIIIVPTRPEVIYVPYYDPRVVYGHWHWRHHPPVYWEVYPDYYHAGHYGHFYWSPGIHISFNFFFGAVNWHRHHVVVVDHHHSHVYRRYDRIVSSQGAQRWRHEPRHRHGVAYRSTVLTKRYDAPRSVSTPLVRDGRVHDVRRQDIDWRSSGTSGSSERSSEKSSEKNNGWDRRHQDASQVRQVNEQRERIFKQRLQGDDTPAPKAISVRERDRGSVSKPVIENEQRHETRRQIQPVREPLQKQESIRRSQEQHQHLQRQLSQDRQQSQEDQPQRQHNERQPQVQREAVYKEKVQIDRGQREPVVRERVQREQPQRRESIQREPVQREPQRSQGHREQGSREQSHREQGNREKIRG